MVVGIEGRTEESFVEDDLIDDEILDRVEIVPITADGEGSIIPELEVETSEEDTIPVLLV